MHIRVVTPITTEGYTTAEIFDGATRPDTQVTVTALPTGPASIESEFDEAFALPGTVIRILEAERDGADAVVIDCMADPGLNAGREAVDIPVVGASQGAMHLAAMLAHEFSIVTVLETLRPLLENTATLYGLRSKLASVRAVEIPVLELKSDTDALVAALVEESVAAIERDGAQAIVFGCTGMKGCAAGLATGLAERGYEGMPVIDPVIAATKLAESLVDLGLTHSRRTYASPRKKPITGYDLSAGEALGVSL